MRLGISSSGRPWLSMGCLGWLLFGPVILARRASPQGRGGVMTRRRRRRYYGPLSPRRAARRLVPWWIRWLTGW